MLNAIKRRDKKLKHLLDYLNKDLDQELHNCFIDCKRRNMLQKKYICFVECSVNISKRKGEQSDQMNKFMQERDIALEELLVIDYNVPLKLNN